MSQVNDIVGFKCDRCGRRHQTILLMLPEGWYHVAEGIDWCPACVTTFAAAIRAVPSDLEKHWSETR